MAEENKKNELVEDLKNIGLVIGGVVIGRLIDVGAQKVLKLDNNAPASGIELAKKFISPSVQIIGGTTGALLIKNNDLKMLSAGVAASGAATALDIGVQKIFNKSQVSGMGATYEPNYIDQQIDNMVSEIEYDPNLPDLAIEGAREDTYKAVPERELSFREEDSEEDEFDEAEII